MFDLGFKHFVGVDGSKGMLEQAAKSGLYRELKLALLGTDPLTLWANKADNPTDTLAPQTRRQHRQLIVKQHNWE